MFRSTPVGMITDREAWLIFKCREKKEGITVHKEREEWSTDICFILRASFAPIKHYPTGCACGGGLFSDRSLIEGQMNDASMKIHLCGGLNNHLPNRESARLPFIRILKFHMIYYSSLQPGCFMPGNGFWQHPLDGKAS